MGAAAQEAVHYPGPGDEWEHRKAEQVGLDAGLLGDGGNAVLVRRVAVLPRMPEE